MGRFSIKPADGDWRTQQTMKLSMLTILVVCLVGGVAAAGRHAQTTAPQIDPSRIAARKELGQLGVEYSRDSFIKVAREGDTITVQLTISAGMQPDVMDKDGLTALAAAAVANQTETIRALLAGGAAIDARMGNGSTALMMASDADKLEAVRQLLDSGADPNVEAGSRTALFNAHSKKVVEALVGKGANVDARSKSGRTPLMAASGERRIEVVKALLEARANANARDEKGWTALMAASLAGSLESAEALLGARADPNAEYKNGESALSLAVRRILSGGGRDDDPVVRILLEHGASPETKDDRGLPLVVEVVRGDRVGLAELLIEKGMSPNTRTPGDDTLLIEAVASGHADMVKLLVSKGADVNLKGEGNQTALGLALRSNRADLAQILVAAGAK